MESVEEDPFPRIRAKGTLKRQSILVDAAGVEPDIGVENAQLADSGNASNSSNARIAGE
jgi:hypothetical protein